MASQGPLSPGTLANEASFGTPTWSDPANAAAEDGSSATVIVGAGVSSQYLMATNFGFTIPAGATIDGITVEIKKAEGDTGDDLTDSRVRIVKGGAIGTEDKSDVTEWPTTLAYTTYGGAADLWGETWTYSDINDSGFGVVISAVSTPAADGSIDHIRITVTYTAGAGGGQPLLVAAASSCRMIYLRR